MKTSTIALTVNRLLTSLLTLTFLIFAGNATALTGNQDLSVQPVNGNTSYNPGIEYTSLVATATAKSVFINWVTANELNNSHFEVERSLDMQHFITVAMVLDGFAAAGTPGKIYKFKEASGEVKNGKTVYYRLKQIDTNNQVHYSTIMAVQLNTVVTVYPNSEVSNDDVNNTTKTSYPAEVQQVYSSSQYYCYPNNLQ